MRKHIYYIVTLFFLQTAFTACTDTEIYDSPENGKDSQLKIILNVPVDNARTRGLVHGPDEDPTNGESVINDTYVLAFKQNNNQYIGKFQASYSNSTLTAKINVKEVDIEPMNIVVLTNLNSLENGNELVGKIDGLKKGTAKDEVLKSLQYNFTNKWVLNDRPLPMWGETNITPVKETTVSGTINLFRAVSKINVTFNKGTAKYTNDGTEIFKLKSVRVYYARTSGLAGSLFAPVYNEEGGSDLIVTPSIPYGVSYYPRYKEGGMTPNNLLFTTTSEKGGYAIENQIYVPESDQTNTEEPMCLVIGGYYMGNDQETFYRVDFKQGNQGQEYYNAIRNHIYNFNINTVTRPGTDEPDPALDHVVVGMDVTITDWTTEYMQGIGGQYTLKVSTGGFVFASDNTSTNNEITVETTHNAGWDITDQSGDWYSLKKENGKIIVTPKAKNEGGQRRGSFVITSGNLRKEITVRQQGKGTANCYVVSDKIVNGEYQHILHDLIVTVKGNGEEGLVADGHPFKDSNPNLEPDEVKVIWETAKGLINIKAEGGKPFINENGIIQYSVDLSKQNQDILKDDKNQLGGNALIGAFKDGEIIWTWHIWVCPDFDSSNDLDGEITTEELISHTQTWATNNTTDGYDFLDRYLGALSNKPGLASLGLLYQWGRKDPFIGAASISEKQSLNRMHTDNLPEYTWKNSTSNISIAESVKKPTTLINGTIADDDDYKFLWGTDKGFSDVRDAGNKTIYDPCPKGYRVPPVSAIVFKYGNTTSEKTNYQYNNSYWPNTSSYISPENAGSYGFWINHQNSTIRPSLHEYEYGKKKPVSINGATWLPLAGVYDGDIDKFALVDENNSLTVNSIIWTNSSVTIKDNLIRPGALFLHGTEPENSANGRHLHRLIENSNNLYAKKTHAGSVRCIRDTKSSIQNAISVPSSITLGSKKGSSISDYLTSITDSWEVIDPGANWFVMTPDQGNAGSKQPIKFTATKDNLTYSSFTAYVKIRFNDENKTEKTIEVIQEGRKQPSVSPSSITFDYEGGKETVSLISDVNWKATINTDANWLTMSQNSGSESATIEFTAPKYNEYNVDRTATITVTFSEGPAKTITVKQSGKKRPTVTSPTKILENNTDRKNSVTGNILSPNDSWTISGVPDWLSASSTSGNAWNYNRPITFKPKTVNPNTTERSATITVTFESGYTQTMTIKQKGGSKNEISIVPDDEVLQFAGFIEGLFGGTYAPSIQTVTINGTGTWTASTKDTWITIKNNSYWESYSQSTSGTAPNEKLEIQLEKRTSGKGNRTGTITIKGETGNPIEITIKQSSKEE